MNQRRFLKWLRRPRLPDTIVLACVCVASAWIGVSFQRERAANPYGDSLQVAAMLACGRGFTVSEKPTAEFAAFARRARPTLACAEFANATPIPASAFASGYRYAIYSIAAAIRLGGLSWTTLDMYLGVLFGLSMGLAYGLFRLAVDPALALCGIVGLVCSNHLLALGVDVRDYGKEPWFIALWLAIGWLLRLGSTEATRAIYLPAAAAGAVLGIGLGFRVDLMIFFPVLLAVIVVGVRGWTRSALRIKATATALFVSAFALSGAPILTTMAQGSNSSHVIVLGLSVPFTRALGLDAPVYDLGDLYADGFAEALTSAHTTLVQRDRDVGALGTARYDEQGGKLLLHVARAFPADVAVRALGATRQIISYPFDAAVRAEDVDIESLNSVRVTRALVEWRDWFGGWMDGHAVLLAALAFVAVSMYDPRTAVVCTVLVFYFCGYSMLQFSRRHTFHLDVIPIGLVLVTAAAAISVVRWPIDIYRSGTSIRDAIRAVTRRLLVAVAPGAVLVVMCIAGISALRWWQQRGVNDLLARTLVAGWADMPVLPEPLSADGRPPSPTWQELYRANPKLWASAVLLRVPPFVDTAPGQPSAGRFLPEYLLVEIGGARCAPRPVPVALKYSSERLTFDFEYTRAFDVPVEAGGGPSALLVPILLNRGVSKFDGVAVPADRTACVLAVRRADPPSAVPLPILFAVLPPGWRSTPLYQRLTASAAPGLNTPVVAAPAASVTDAPPDASFGDSLPVLSHQAPDLGEWIVLDDVSLIKSGAGYIVHGNSSQLGYQLMSPAIDVTLNSTLLVRVQGRVEAGAVCVGVLQGSQQRFLLAPGRRRREYRVRTGQNERVRIVFANCGGSAGAEPSRFTVESVSYQIEGWRP